MVRSNTSRRANNRGSYWSARRGKEVSSKEEALNFFITEFPKEMSAKDLFEIFKGYGLVMKVAIPPRRDKKGRRYEFMRFGKVDNERELATKLVNIFTRGRKLYANIPIFNKDGREYENKHKVGVEVKRTEAEAGIHKGDEQGKGLKENILRGEENLYVNMLKGGVKEGQGKRNTSQYREINNIEWCGKEKLSRFAHLQINMKEEDLRSFCWGGGNGGNDV